MAKPPKAPKTPKTPKINPHGSPNKNNIRRTSNPKTSQERIQAIADDIESAVRAYIPVLQMEGALNRQNIRQVLGSGGPGLNLFEDEFEKNYPNAAIKGEESKEIRKRKTSPVLDKVSKDTSVDYDLPQQKNKNASNKNPNTNRKK